MAKGAQTRARTVEAFLSAGLKVFAEQGFHAATMAQICERAALSRSAFYANFAGKDELFLALFERHGRRKVAAIEDALNANRDSVRVVLAAVEAALSNAGDERDWALVSTEFSIYAARNDRAGRRLVEHDRLIRRRLATAMAELDFLSADGDCEAAAAFVIALYEGAMLASLVDGDDDGWRAMLREYIPRGLGVASRSAGEVIHV